MPRFTLPDTIIEVSQNLLTPMIEQTLRKGNYEWQERLAIKQHLKPGDTVLEIGAGIGLTTLTAARIVGAERVVSVEGNPALLPEILRNLALNGLTGVTLLNKIVLPEAGKTEAHLYVPDAFWGASIDGLSQPLAREITVAAIGFDALLAAHPASVLVCDVEGAEAEFFQNPLPESLRMIVLELHPKLYALKTVKAIFDRLSAQRFAYVPYGSKGPVICFKRV